jgi:catechol 2,3-dioxygenase-like lactoylglutathione lyase family enzyme
MRVSHIILRVHDMAEAIAFYRDRVGLAVIMESDEFSFLDGGSIRIALNARADVEDDRSMTEIVMEVDDLRMAHSDLAGRGVPFEIEPRVVTSDGVRSLVATHFHDPDGHLISITGWE